MLHTRIPLAVLQAPFQVGVAAVSAVLGFAIVATVVLPLGFAVTALQAVIPPVLAVAWGISLGLGGAGTLAAMIRHAKDPAWSVVTETTSLVFLAIGWAIYGTGALFGVGFVAPLIVSTCMVLASAVRIRAIVVAVRVAKETTALRQEVE